VPIPDLAVGPDQDDRVVDRPAARLAIALVDAAYDGDLVLLRGGAQWRQLVCREVHRIRQQPRVERLGERHVAARPQPPDPYGIAGDVGLRKDHQLCTVGGALLDGPDRVGKGARTVEQLRGSLNDCELGHGRLSIGVDTGAVRMRASGILPLFDPWIDGIQAVSKYSHPSASRSVVKKSC